MPEQEILIDERGNAKAYIVGADDRLWTPVVVLPKSAIRGERALPKEAASREARRMLLKHAR